MKINNELVAFSPVKGFIATIEYLPGFKLMLSLVMPFGRVVAVYDLEPILNVTSVFPIALPFESRKIAKYCVPVP